MRIRTLALAVALMCGVGVLAQAQMGDQSASRKAAQKRAKKQAKRMKAPKRVKNKAPKAKRAKVKHRNA
jgi:hypothetical protein